MMCNMLIWINGPFGVGKTQTAFELYDRLPGSFVSDPEEHGFALFRTLPRNLRGDFQDLPMWRHVTFETLRHLSDHHAGPVIVPMTLVKKEYFEETVGRLRASGVDVRHFTLMASRETLLKRLRSRGESKNGWPAQQMDRCLEGLQDETFGVHLKTDTLNISEQAEHIAKACGLTLLPAQKNPLMQKIRRWSVTFRHFRN